MKYLNTLRLKAGVRTLLSAIDANPKVAKNGKLGILTSVLHLAPGDMSGHEVCPKRSPGCSAACLHFAGSPAYLTNKTQARIKKTKLFFADRNIFLNILALEMAEHIKIADKKNMEPAFRLNGTSDIVWERKKFILWPETVAALTKIGVPFNRDAIVITDLFPTVSYYDYTAIAGRVVPDNYHLTFSLKEQNMNDTLAEIARGLNVAAVFPVGQIPASFLGLPVIDGDEHDYRPADPQGCVVGLKVKGLKGRADDTGFVYRVIEPDVRDIFPVEAHEDTRVRASAT